MSARIWTRLAPESSISAGTFWSPNFSMYQEVADSTSSTAM
jgi:hypothetical protein